MAHKIVIRTSTRSNWYSRSSVICHPRRRMTRTLSMTPSGWAWTDWLRITMTQAMKDTQFPRFRWSWKLPCSKGRYYWCIRSNHRPNPFHRKVGEAKARNKYDTPTCCAPHRKMRWISNGYHKVPRHFFFYKKCILLKQRRRTSKCFFHFWKKTKRRKTRRRR